MSIENNWLQEVIWNKAQLKNENERSLSSIGLSSINPTTLQEKLVNLWQNLWTFWVNWNWVDWDLWNITFKAIQNIQWKLNLPITWVVDFTLITLLYPRKFRTYNKQKNWRTIEQSINYVKEKILWENNEIRKKSISKIKELKDVIINSSDQYEQIDLGKHEKKGTVLNEGLDLEKNRATMSSIESYFDEYISYKAEWELYTKSGVTRCAWIARDTLQENWIKPFQYTAKWWRYNFTNVILNPRNKDKNIFLSWDVTIPNKIMKISSFDRNKNIDYKWINGKNITELYKDDYEDLNSLLNEWEQVSIIMNGTSRAWQKYWHLVAWMKINWELLIIDPHYKVRSRLDRREPIKYENYSLKRNITGVLVYGNENNPTYLASIEKNGNNNV